MTEKNKKYLSDILMAIQLINEFLVDVAGFTEYSADLKTQSAVERQLAIIGEVLNKISKEPDALRIESSAQIIGLRNRLIHAYDSIDSSIIWAILKKHLPELEKEVKNLYPAD
jgi:uncharacterized protein with HEPN domain